jgi:hypothetical protein
MRSKYEDAGVMGSTAENKAAARTFFETADDGNLDLERLPRWRELS